MEDFDKLVGSRLLQVSEMMQKNFLVENGAFYITSRDRLLSSGNRLSGNIRIVEMNESTYFEIDEPSDWLITEMLMKEYGIVAPTAIPEIKMFLMDCDRCLTDGGMYYSEYGDELKKINARDGMGIRLLRENGTQTSHLNKCQCTLKIQ